MAVTFVVEVVRIWAVKMVVIVAEGERERERERKMKREWEKEKWRKWGGNGKEGREKYEGKEEDE